MRWVISVTAFFIPLLLIISIGSCFIEVDPTATSGRASLSPVALDELRRYVQANEGILDLYAAKPGEKPTGSMPHLSLERFDRRGIDSSGQPWFRLVAPPPKGVGCGLLRRATGGVTPVTDIDGHPTCVVMPLSGRWSYWETQMPKPRAPKSP